LKSFAFVLIPEISELFFSKMVFQINPFLEDDEGKDFKLLSKRFNDNKIIKAIR
jgi:hypothetical protein